ncbi:GNAT family N-acetyltransferase [Microbacterium sp. MPKO10]|uniref:GNAT family N-acetyltransferase n=1 Tax=Microbacterium sp. MPKO10 TaxID=2989818 RepID=UPI00223564C0|nr:GNAT family N-acetyltransferase [Microbacterium sp. MPKO10]MCW4457459.1 GNAT family N-acetyltransferase [Microbacterium sp. MPKO10]
MDFTDAPLDQTAAANLAEQNLTFARVDTANDRERYTGWHEVVNRGFYGDRKDDKDVEYMLDAGAYRRLCGVWDDTEAGRDPVATIGSWTTPLSVPGGDVPAWAISAVTVSPTHRRRGIARNFIEAELRTAHACGVPVAALTASEATIYGRFGFAPSARDARITIDTKRARWTGPTPTGRVRFMELGDLYERGRAVADRASRQHPGEVAFDEMLWTGTIEYRPGKDDTAKDLRAVGYTDAAGELQGFAAYRVKPGADEKLIAKVAYLSAATDDAYAALWRYLIELDLVDSVEADLRSVDEPVLWQVSDLRAVTVAPFDHLWLRILDPVAMLEARTYARPGSVVLDVVDPLEFAQGRFLLEIDVAGTASVSRLSGDAPADAAHVTLSERDLAQIAVGGTSVTSLHRAGRVSALTDGAVERVDAAFHSPVAPRLSFWF